MRRAAIALTALLAPTALLVLSACGGDAAGEGPGLDPSATGTLTVTSNQTLPGPHGELFTEGALVEVQLESDGDVLATQTADAGRPIVFRHLSHGSYVVAAATRPCEGNCAELDPRQDGCRTTVRVPADQRVHVVYQASRHCRFGG